MSCDTKPTTNNTHENLRAHALMLPQSGDFTGEVTEDDPSQEEFVCSRPFER